jgi:hypothetical protein
MGKHCPSKCVPSCTEREKPHSLVGIGIEHYFTIKPEMSVRNKDMDKVA